MAYIKTQWENDVTPLNEGNMNKIEQGIYENSLQLFDVVVDSQTKFNELLLSPSWLGAESVAIVGRFEHTGKITIPQSVKKIQGFKTSRITILGTSSNEEFAFGYASKPSDIDYSISDLTVFVDAGGDSATFSSCVKNCINTRNIMVLQFAETSVGTQGCEVKLFDSCDNLTNCVAEVTGESGVGFYNCQNVSKCGGSSQAITYNLFNGCKDISDCTIKVENNQSLQSPSIFTNCSFLRNCHITFSECSATGQVSCFTFCYNLSNCSCELFEFLDTEAEYDVYGFLGCNKMSSCVASVDDATAESIKKSLYCTFVDISCDIA